MDYKKRYKEALEKAKKLYGKYCINNVLEDLFPELKESENDRIVRCLLNYFNHVRYNGLDLKDTDVDEVIAWLEKQGENKSVDKPKFKVGDWITDGHLTCKVLSVTGKFYELHLYNDDYCHFETDVQSVDKRYHLWTIADAKDGDVLVAKDDRPFIFTGEFDVQDDNPTAYCGINSSDKFITGMGSHWTFKDGIKPATKEQQDLLFAKIKAAGYEWDSEKKELKKIEPKTIDADKVIEWLKNTIRETKEYFGEGNMFYNIRLTLPYNYIEDLINNFKENFRL